MKIVWLLRGALSVEVASTHFTVQNVSEMKNYLTETSASKGECLYVTCVLKAVIILHQHDDEDDDALNQTPVYITLGQSAMKHHFNLHIYSIVSPSILAW